MKVGHRKINRPSYIKINGHKIRTPKEIVKFSPSDKSRHIYGDSRLVDVPLNISKELLYEIPHTQILVVLKKQKAEGGGIVFPIAYSSIIDSRKQRLAHLLNEERNALYSNDDDVVKFNSHQVIRDELSISDEEMPREQLFELFLTSSRPGIISKDIKRIIHLQFEQQWNNGK